MKALLLLVLLLFPISVYSQKLSSHPIAIPDSVIIICTALMKQEAGDEIFNSCIRFDTVTGTKSLYEGNQERLDYAVGFNLAYPQIKEATFPLTMNYFVYSGKGHLQSGRFLRFDKTDLPEGIDEKGIKLIPLQQIKDSAMVADKMVSDADPVFVLGVDGFYWSFTGYFDDPNPQGDAQNIITHTVNINPLNGRVISKVVY